MMEPAPVCANSHAAQQVYTTQLAHLNIRTRSADRQCRILCISELGHALLPCLICTRSVRISAIYHSLLTSRSSPCLALLPKSRFPARALKEDVHSCTAHVRGTAIAHAPPILRPRFLFLCRPRPTCGPRMRTAGRRRTAPPNSASWQLWTPSARRPWGFGGGSILVAAVSS